MLQNDKALWQTIIQEVIANGGNLIRPWFTQLVPISLENFLLEIEVPGYEEKRYCETHAKELFTQAAQTATGMLVGVCFLTTAQREESGEFSGLNEIIDQTMSGPSLGLFNTEYTFEYFVTGRCNRLAHAASCAVSESPGRTYNPLFLHGASGLGKTHLLQAVCHTVLKANPDVTITYITCEEFVNNYIEAVANGTLAEFRDQYRQTDILAIDDIQFLTHHEACQEEFFHTFNTLYQSQKQIILTSDRCPNDTPLEERLISRFNWGMVTHIDRPCYETRVAILRKKAAQREMNLPDDAICYIAGLIDSNTRELEGAIAKVAMLAQVTGRRITPQPVEEALGSAPQATSREVTIDDILNVVTDRFGVRTLDLQGKKRTRSIAWPRQICMYLARTLTNHSLEEIGGYFGGRDHTTVMHAVKTVEAQKTQEPQFQATLEKMTQDISAGS